jgi:hypothetical protein
MSLYLDVREELRSSDILRPSEREFITHHPAIHALTLLLQGVVSGIFFSALGPVLSEVVGLKDFADSLSIIWLVTAPITLTGAPIAFALNQYSQSVLGRTGPEIFQIGIGVAGGANIIAAASLFTVKWFQRKDQD